MDIARQQLLRQQTLLTIPVKLHCLKNRVSTGLIDYRYNLTKKNVLVKTLLKDIEWLDNNKTNSDEYYQPGDYFTARAKEKIKFSNFIL